MAVTRATNAIVDDPVQAAMDAIVSGKDAFQAVYGTSERGPEMPEDLASAPEAEPVLEPEAPELEASEEVGDEVADKKSASSKKNAKTPEEDETAETDSNPIGDFEEVRVKGLEGKSQVVKVDYKNKDSIKQAYLKAAGFPVLNNKLSVLSKKHAGLEKEHKSLKADMDKLEDIYQNQGVEALVKALGKEGELDKLVQAKIKQREYLASLSPEEKYRLEMKEQNEQALKRASDVETKYQKMLEDISQKEEQAATRSLESRLHPAFDRYRFSGKLGDEGMEHMLDETIWNQVTKRLTDYPEDVELTQSVIDREFRTVSQNLQKVIHVQAEKKVQKTVDKKKAEAVKTAQITAKKGLTGQSEKDKFMDSIKSGNLSDAFQSVLSGKVRL